MRQSRCEASDEGGFTLIEVVVALFLIGVVAAGALLFFVRGMQNTSHLQRTQAATTIATQGMELVRAVDPRATTGTSGLLMGRSKGDVQAIWNAADPADKAETNMAWDDLTPSADPEKQAVRLVRTTIVSDMKYTTTTLIGTCYRSGTASSAKQPCTAAKPAAPVLMYRATVVVEWKAGKAGQCDVGTCSYRLTSLIDPTVDASWNLSAKPVAYDDAATYTAGDPKVFFDILANDVLTHVTSNPTTIIVPPAHGSVAVVGSGDTNKMGAVYYTPPTDYSGPVSFTYKLRDAQGRNSNEAIVSIAVLPRASDDTATVAKGATVDIPVTGNDKGTTLVPKITTPPSSASGSATIVGNTIRFVASSSAPIGVTSFKYVVTDSSNQVSLEATVNVSITAPVVPATDVSFDVLASNAATPPATPLLIQKAAGVPATYKVHVIAGPTAASGTPAAVGVLNGTGTTALTYKPTRNTVGFYTFTFQFEDNTGTRSATKTATIRVVPVAAPFSFKPTVSTDAVTPIVVIGGNVPDVKTTSVTYAVSAAPAPTCSLGTATARTAVKVTMPADTTAGSFNFTRPKWTGDDQVTSGSCTFSYTMTWTQGAQTYTTPAAVVSVPVTR